MEWILAAASPMSVATPSRSLPKCEGDRFWVPAVEVRTIDGCAIDGMLYMGSGLRPVSEYRGSVEPALVDPRCRVSWAGPDRDGTLMGYWPSYSALDPTSRAAYLHWLIQGRK